MLTRSVKLERVTAELGDGRCVDPSVSHYALSLDLFFFVNLLTGAALKVHFWIINVYLLIASLVNNMITCVTLIIENGQHSAQ